MFFFKSLDEIQKFIWKIWNEFWKIDRHSDLHGEMKLNISTRRGRLSGKCLALYKCYIQPSSANLTLLNKMLDIACDMLVNTWNFKSVVITAENNQLLSLWRLRLCCLSESLDWKVFPQKLQGTEIPSMWILSIWFFMLGFWPSLPQTLQT